jgi:hypothetical protein
LYCTALCVSAGSLVAPAIAHLAGSELLAAGASAGVMLAVARLAWGAVPPAEVREWCVGADGAIAVRCNGEIWRDVPVVFTSTMLIVLQHGNRKLGIWRDATPFPAFRRLSVAARWRTPHRGPPFLTGINQADASERT